MSDDRRILSYAPSRIHVEIKYIKNVMAYVEADIFQDTYISSRIKLIRFTYFVQVFRFNGNYGFGGLTTRVTVGCGCIVILFVFLSDIYVRFFILKSLGIMQNNTSIIKIRVKWYVVQKLKLGFFVKCQYARKVADTF